MEELLDMIVTDESPSQISDKIKELGQKENLNIDVLELDVDDENSVKTAIQKILDQKQRIKSPQSS